ncbi:quinohemoprotein amine dehydrogenase subunit alpha [Desulfobacula phenolica]|uniref:Quinohemoprotein amine dehydrogenase, alpha subunit n=1 Tax=Desulfobacula phenolica TaxID=90732 RepID=A0A1H2I9Z5_9BACT|nr:quinohemoprotein amine dehydrogenase subunit alpha [Desulfobacula phenolica]SDU40960.1 quinohemoprotein amine dehydrogenase, alpha subunit [Desulfobacula phenolica]
MRKLIRLSTMFILLGIYPLAGSTVYGDVLFGDTSMVRQKCAACHKPDTKGRLEVIEETRKSTEEWKVVVDRMIRLNSAPLEDEEFYPVIKELSKTLCLTPEESDAVAYLNSDENSQYREIPKNDLETRIYTACVRCHTFGKIASHKMTKDQWNENRNLHLGYYPTVIPQMREMDWYKESEALNEPLSKLFAFDTPEYKKWLKNRKDQDLTGQWNVAGYQPGMGYYQGVYTIEPNPAKGEDEYFIEKKIQYKSGLNISTKGEGTLFSEYHLRYALAPTPLTGRVEGVFDLNADTMGFKGKWWTVVQDSNAYGNEAFYKADSAPKIIAAFPQSLRVLPGTEQTLTLVGVGLSENISKTDVRFSDPNITVTSLVKTNSSELVCNVIVAAGAATGLADVSVKKLNFKGLKIFDKIDAISVSPKIGRARVSSGAAYPPQGVQFVARGINFGADGKQGTSDDLVLDPVTARWELEEEKTREDDDDMAYLNVPLINGLYTPTTTYGPIKTRKQNREGVGLIAVNAMFEDQGRQLTDRVRLAVTVPDYITHLK